MSSVNDFLSGLDAEIQGRICRFQGSHLREACKFPFPPREETEAEVEFQDAVWSCSWTAQAVHRSQPAIDLTVRFRLVGGNATETNVGVEFQFNRWAKANFVLMPGAVYNGNRFESRRLGYPPLLTEQADLGPEVPTIITDVPRLNLHEGPSRIQQLTRDLATPAVGFYEPGSHRGFWLLTPQRNQLGDLGYDLEENHTRTRAVLRVTTPGVREDVRYTICNTQVPCEDRGADFVTNDTVELCLRLHVFDCRAVQGLFDRFVQIREDLSGPVAVDHELPFSAAWSLLEDKYNRENWNEKYGYYTVGIGQEIYAKWQIGWNGGLMTTHPLLFAGNSLSRSRALRNFDFVFPHGQADSGFFRGIGDGERWYSDGFGKPHAENWHLVRKSSDALYFLLKQFLLFARQEPAWRPPTAWETGARRCADAFVQLWDRHGQFGQFVDINTGEIVVGGSAGAATAPAGLALAAEFFHNDRYLQVARDAGLAFHEKLIRAGYTTGGPGEACQCPDSESAFGLLESFMTLYEVTQDRIWIERAQDTANQCATWCVSYDYVFPPQSTFGRLGIKTAGAVLANAQNKHAAPGICTLSGVSLFKLYRATRDRFYLKLIRDIAHNLTQYLSRPDRHIAGMPPGWINERVNLSDWLEPIGEVFCGSSWSEASCMMTYVEVPGLYVQPDSGFVFAIDHVEARVEHENDQRLVVRVTNPTAFEARIKVVAENTANLTVPWGQNALWGCMEILLGSKESKVIEFPKPTSRRLITQKQVSCSEIYR